MFVSTGLSLGLGSRMRDIYASEEKARPILDKVLAFLISKKKNVKTYWKTAQEIETLLTTEEVWIKSRGMLANKRTQPPRRRPRVLGGHRGARG